MGLVCGIDEAGRGCIAGSLFVAGVVCEETQSDALFSLGVRDSKKLSRPKRFALERELCGAMRYYVVRKSASEIDSMGLSVLLAQALREIIEHFYPLCSHFIFDGNTTFDVVDNRVRLETLVRGDMLLAPIACASIIAKCAKDRESMELDRIYPNYGLASHSGYGTKAHYDAIATHGLSPIHRASFIKPTLL